MGFSTTACITAPQIASPAPATIDRRMRGIRIFQTIWNSDIAQPASFSPILSTRYFNISITWLNGTLALPTVMTSTMDTANAISSTTIVVNSFAVFINNLSTKAPMPMMDEHGSRIYSVLRICQDRTASPSFPQRPQCGESHTPHADR